MNYYNDILKTLYQGGRNALELGKAAEHLVCADLILSGYKCFLSDQGISYDAVVDIAGRLVRIQVKSTSFPQNLNARGRTERMGYSFAVRKFGKDGLRRLTGAECDIIALVALDTRTIAYLPFSEVGTTCQFMPDGYAFKGRYRRTRGLSISGFPFAAALERLLEMPHV